MEISGKVLAWHARYPLYSPPLQKTKEKGKKERNALYMEVHIYTEWVPETDLIIL